MDDLFFRDSAVTVQDDPSLVVVEMTPERWTDGFLRHLLAKEIRCRVTSASDELDTIHIAPILRHSDGSETVADDTLTYTKKEDLGWNEGPQAKYRFSCATIDFEKSSCSYNEDLKKDGNNSEGDDTGNTFNTGDDSPTTKPSSLREPPRVANASLRPSTSRFQLIDVYLDV